MWKTIPTLLALCVVSPGASVIVNGPGAVTVFSPTPDWYTVIVNVCGTDELLRTAQSTECAVEGSPNRPLERRKGPVGGTTAPSMFLISRLISARPCAGFLSSSRICVSCATSEPSGPPPWPDAGGANKPVISTSPIAIPTPRALNESRRNMATSLVGSASLDDALHH